jgi:hypothetical protein
MPPDPKTEPHVRIPLVKIVEMIHACAVLDRAAAAVRATAWVVEHVAKPDQAPEAAPAEAPNAQAILCAALHDLLTRPTDPAARIRAREALQAAEGAS